MPVYATEQDLYRYGLPRGALSNAARLVTANATSDSFTLDEHGFALNDVVTFRADADGALPTGIAEGVEYYVIPVNHYTFKVSATASGSAVNFTTAGSFVLVIKELPIQGALEWASLIIEQNLLGHCVPLELPYHQLIVATCAQLAAGLLLNGSESKSLAAMVVEASNVVAKWSKGQPLRGENKPAAAQAAGVARSASVPYCDARGWGKYGGIS
jgi:hypothetical protein